MLVNLHSDRFLTDVDYKKLALECTCLLCYLDSKGLRFGKKLNRFVLGFVVFILVFYWCILEKSLHILGTSVVGRDNHRENENIGRGDTLVFCPYSSYKDS